jgi:hypothetical protein
MVARCGAGIVIMLAFFGPQAPAHAQGAAGLGGPYAGSAAPVLVNLRTLHVHPASPRVSLPFRHPRGQGELDRAKRAAQGLAPGAVTAPSSTAVSSSLLQSFNGISSNETSCFCAPPDGAIAASPSYVIGAVNTAFKIWNPQGGLVGPAIELSALFSVNPACLTSSDFFGALSDPFVEYDKAAGRFIVGAVSFDALSYDSAICIAVTVTGDPTGTWAIYAFHVDGTAPTLFDFPHLGVGSDALYVTGNLFPNGANFSGVRVYAFNKAQMYADQVATWQYQEIPVGSLGTFDTFSPAREVGVAKTMYFTAAENCTICSMSRIAVWKWSDPFGANAFSQTGTIAIQPYAQPPNAVQPGSTTTIDTNDTRVLGSQWYQGTIYAVHTIGANPGGGTVPAVQWFQLANLDGGLAVVQQGMLASPGRDRYFPNLTMDSSGDMGLVYAYSSATDDPGVWYTGRLASDSLGTLEAEAPLKAGETAIAATDTTANTARYGDYAGTSLAPDGCTIWQLEEYAQSGATWGTWVAAYHVNGCGSSQPAGVLSFTPSTGQTLTAGSPSSALTAQLVNSQGNTISAASPISVGLSSSSSAGSFATSTAGPWTSTLSLTIPQGGSTTPPFYYEDTKAGSPSLTASAAGYTSATQHETVNAAILATIMVSPSPASVPAGGKQTFTASGADQFGNPVSVSNAGWGVSPAGLGTLSPASGASTTLTAGKPTANTNGTVTAFVGSVTGSAPVTVTAVPAPTSLTAAPGRRKITLTWSESASGVTFNVYRGTRAGGELLLKTGITSIGYTDSVVSRVRYFYYVKAVNTYGALSGASNEVSAVAT